MKKNWTLIEVIRKGTEYLEKKNIESPRLNIELLLADLFGLSRMQLYTQYDKPLTQDEIDEINQRCLRRGKREPLQYIIGRHQFIDLYLNIDERALIPRPETEILADFASKWLAEKDDYSDVLDIGAGSGCISLYLASKCPKSQVVGLDISEQAIELAKENANANNITNVKFFVADILCTKPKKQYDLVVSNPPYISENDYNELETELFFEPKMALSDGGDGLKFYERYSQIFPYIIKPNGIFIIEIGYKQENSISNLFSKTDFQLELVEDYSGKNRFIRGMRK